ncbi:MAG: cytochrome c-type biogenesis protein CcmH [Chloroflexi bacterium]|nr:cytochrome c-type biogenesis protein CcmH [Chloroflexota bacterium]
MVRKMLGAVFVLLALLATPASAASPLTNVSQQLICQCGCNMTVANCTHQDCMSAPAMRTLIQQKLDQGLSEEQVVQYFVTEYGEQVLASPPKKGLNLVAWILPFAVIIAGAIIVYLALKKWVFQGRTSQVEVKTEAEEDDEKYRLRLEQELKQFGERGYR